MGLLTDPNTGAGGASKIVNIVIKYHKILSWFLYLGGVVFLLVLAHPIYNERTYFSENALLPGLVTGGFNQGRAAAALAGGAVPADGAGGAPAAVPAVLPPGQHILHGDQPVRGAAGRQDLQHRGAGPHGAAPPAQLPAPVHGRRHRAAARHRPPNSPHQST